MTVSATYDFSTGLLRTSTDENNQTSTVHYFPQTLRYYLTSFPDTGYSAINYDDRLFADPDSSHMHSFTMQTVATGVGTVVHSYDFYDGRGAVVRHYEDYAAADSGNATTDIEYDAMGRVRRVSNPYYSTNGTSTPLNLSGVWTTNTYDELGRVKQVTLTDDTTVETTYAGTVTTVTDQAGKQRRQKVDALGRVVRVDEPDANGSLGTVSSPNQPTTYEYDKLDNLIHVTQAGPDNVTQNRYFKYDSLSRLTYERQVEMAAPYSTSDSVAGNSQWSKKLLYNSQGLISDAYDARQVHTQFTYDGLNRLTGISYLDETSPDQTPAVTYTYDQSHSGYYNNDRLTSVSTAATTNAPATIQAYDYDIMGRVKAHSQTVGSSVYTTAYGYNLAGWLTSETYPSGRVVSYGYDTAARLSTVKDKTYPLSPKTYMSSLRYAAHGGMTSATLGNGAVESVSYNNRLQPESISLTKDSNTLQKYEYKYGQVDQSTGTVDETKNNGQIARIEGFIGDTKQWQQRFSYDSLGRLSTAGEYRGDTLALTYKSNYSYDRWGNRYQKQSENSQSLSYIPVEDADISPSTNRLTSNTTYDDAGNVTIDQKFRGLRYRYDANGRMWRSANVDDTAPSTSVYDGLGQRVQTTDGSNTKTLVYDAFGRLVSEYDTQAQTSSGGTKYLTSDLQGSARVLTNESGTVLARHDYQAFGGEIGATIGLRTTGQKYNVSDSTRQRYALTEKDATGLDHTWWRKYDNTGGRWTSPDPYNGSMAVADPQSFNRYSYVGNDPVNFTDSSGLFISIIPNIGNVGSVTVTTNWDDLVSSGYLPDITQTGPTLIFLGPIGGDPGRPQTSSWKQFGQNLPRPGAPIYCQPDIIKAMRKAYEITSNGTKNGEAAFTVDRQGNGYRISKITFSPSNPTNGMAAVLSVTITADTIALFHVHPNTGTAYPSGDDPAIARGQLRPANAKQPFPIYTMGGRGLWVFDPNQPNQPELKRPGLDWTKACTK